MENSKLIVNYLPQTLTEQELHSIFDTVGQVESCRVMRDHKTGYSFGYGFVHYVNSEHAEKAILQLNGLQVYNKRIKVSYARPSSETIKHTNLYITNLPRNYSEDDLENLFKPFGTIVQKHILCDKFTGNSRGVAFVRFDKQEEAQNAIQNLNEQELEDSSERLGVRLAEEHGKQRSALYKHRPRPSPLALNGGIGQAGLLHQGKMERLLTQGKRMGFDRSFNAFPPFQRISGDSRVGNQSGFDNSNNQSGFDNSNNIFKPFQGVPGVDNHHRVGNRRGFGSQNNTYMPFRGVFGNVDVPNIGVKSGPMRLERNQNRFRPFAPMTSYSGNF